MTERGEASEQPVVRIGDQMRMFVELIDMMHHDGPEGSLLLVRVRDIQVLPDGTKLLVLERCLEGC